MSGIHPRAFGAAAIALFALLHTGCQADPLCPASQFVPTGPEASEPCDCPDGVLYYCADASACAGEVGKTTCEAPSVHSALNWCPSCRVAFTEQGAVYYDCSARSEDSRP